MSLDRRLEQFGFDAKTVRIYLAVLQLGEAKAYQIAQKAEIHRPTAYDLLDALIDDGLVTHFTKRGVRHYTAENPEKILRQLEERQQNFVQLLPELKSIYNTSHVKPRIKFFEGVEGIKSILEDTLDIPNKVLRGISAVDNLYTIAGDEFMRANVSARIAAEIRLEVIRPATMSGHDILPSSERALREVRYAPPGMEFSMVTYVYNDKVALVSSAQENYGVVIESKEYYQTMNHLFAALWQISAPA